MNETYPPNLSIEDVKVRIQPTSGNPNIGKTHQVVLKNGPRTYRVATIFEIIDPTKKKLHHLSLQLDSFDKTKAGWRKKANQHIRLEGEEPNEIQALTQFLNVALSEHYPNKAGEYHVMPEAKFQLISNFSNLLPELSGSRKLDLISEILKSVEEVDFSTNDVIKAFRTATPETLRNIGVAARFVQYQAAFREFRKLVESQNSNESLFQNHLQNNPWIFGSEYSELLDRRKWTRDDNLDFMLRRTVDGYLEIIEIKTPFSDTILRHDPSHDSFYPSSKLSQALGQVFRYIEEVERKRDSIMAQDQLDPLKIRARVFIGRDGDKRQQTALRTLNSHLHRVEVLTFDQLLRVGEQTLKIFQADFSKAQEKESLT